MPNHSLAARCLTLVLLVGAVAACGQPATGGDAPPLAAYVDKYPFDEVAGIAFLSHPAVVAAVAAATDDETVRRWILRDAGPQGPIEMRAGRLSFFGCEAHNCGGHHWVVSFRPDGSAPEICYHDADRNAAGFDRYRPGGRHETTAEACQKAGD